MRAYLAFTKKEFLEAVRTYKGMLLLFTFLIFGIMNPLTAKLTPVLVAEFMPAGMQIAIPEPSALDSLMQFFKNVPQLGLIVVVLVFSGMLAQEFSKGTLVILLTKGLPRRTVIVSKFTASSVLWTGSYLLCIAVSLIYTAFFWKMDSIPVPELILAFAGLWLFGLLLLSMLLLGSVLLTSSYAAMLFVGGLVVFCFVINMVPSVQNYNPLWLISGNMELINKTAQCSDFIAPAAISIAATVIGLWAAVSLLKKKKIG